MQQLEELCKRLLAAKDEESLANERRVEIEREIIMVTGLPDEGSKTVEAGAYKLKIDQKINRKIDKKAWALVVDQIPDTLRPISIVEEIKVDAKGVRWLKENEIGYYNLLCSAMEEKAAKPAVKVEENK